MRPKGNFRLSHFLTKILRHVLTSREFTNIGLWMIGIELFSHMNNK